MSATDSRPGDGRSVHDDAAAGRAAADRLWDQWPSGWTDAASNTRPPSESWARSAVERLGELVRGQPGLIKASIKGSERGAEALSPRPFQGLLESLQNADDLSASQLKFHVRRSGRRRHLLIVHDGRRVELSHIAAMIMPWVTTKADDASASGRFGIGQRTLTSLGGPLSIHCSPFDVVMDADGPSPAPQYPSVSGFYDRERGETLLVVPLNSDVNTGEISDFVKRLGPESLLFLKSVQRLAFHGAEPDETAVEHRLIRGEESEVSLTIGNRKVIAKRVELRDPHRRGRYIRYMVELPLARGERRYHKAAGRFATLGVAAITSSDGKGRIYDRLPLPVELPYPFNLNAQFDPDAARTTLLRREWNENRLSDIGHLLSAVAKDSFSRDPSEGWRFVPLRSESNDPDTWLNKRLAGLVESVQHEMVQNLRLPADGELRSLSELTYETERLDGLLTSRDLKVLKPDGCPIDDDCKDRAGRWRQVLNELAVSSQVDTADALDIFDLSDDQLGERHPDWYVQFAGAAIDDDETFRFMAKRSVLLANGERVQPPGASDPRSLARSVKRGSLAAALDLALVIHPAYTADSPGATSVVDKLKEHGALVDKFDSDDSALEIIARGLGSGAPSRIKLDNQQLLELRDALERCDPEKQREIGPRIGRNVELRAIRYDSDGARAVVTVSPGGAYLPATIDRDRDSFANAAYRTPGLYWLDPQYASLLKRSGGRRELGAQRFLTRLGAATYPRLIRPSNEARPYKSDWRPASLVGGISRPQVQLREISELPNNRSYLINDRWAPDLDAVMLDIARDPSKRRRKKRALALLAVIVRAWDRHYSDHQFAQAAYASYRLQDPRDVVATWLAWACTRRWLPSASGELSRPIDLCLDTEANRLAYEGEKQVFLCKVDDHILRSAAIGALRLRRGPSASDLVSRLSDLRDQTYSEQVRREAADIYELLALACPKDGRSRPVDDMTIADLKRRFSTPGGRSGLLLVDEAWYPPARVLRGPRIFGRYRPFVTNAPSLEPLWRVLMIPGPSAKDCVNVLGDIAKAKPTRQDLGILIETYRALAAGLGSLSSQQRGRLKRLPLLVNGRWVRSRPIYALEDEDLAQRASEKLPVWQSGFRAYAELGELIPALGVTVVEPNDFEITSENLRAVDEDVRRQYALTVGHLQDELARGDESLYKAISIPWSLLSSADVAVDENLQLTARFGKSLRIRADAHVRLEPPIVIVRNETELGVSETGGRAIASLFSGDRQKVAWAWAAMWERARDGIASDGLVLAGEEVASADSERLVQLQGQARKRRTNARGSTPFRGSRPTRFPTVRDLKSITDLEPDKGLIVNKGKSKRGILLPRVKERKKKEDLDWAAAISRGSSSGTRSVLPPTSEREQLALDAVLTVLQLDESEIADLRARRGIGADAMDDLRQLYEIKMSSTAEFPHEVTLTPSEVDAAQNDPDFFLAVVCGLEDGVGELKVRFIFKPLERLMPRLKGEVTLSGVDEVEALEYVLGRRPAKPGPR